MASRFPQLERFLYSHYLTGGVRQAVGILTPILLVGGLFGLYEVGTVATFGAMCVATIDQPGGPRRHSINAMLGAWGLGTLTAAITGLASTSTLLVWLTVPTLCFLFSMLTVYGRQGGLMGFACLLIMTLTLRVPLSPPEVLTHTLYSFLGGGFYVIYSFIAHRIFRTREEQQSLSVALFATADYIAARARFYDIESELEPAYRKLISTQSAMTEQHQAARNTLLRELQYRTRPTGRRRMASLNIFIDMVALLDTLVATHTDYTTLRNSLHDSDILLFARDALSKLSENVNHIALNIARNMPVKRRSSVKAELRALEFELEQCRHQGFADAQPEVYALLVQVLRRLRNASRIIDRMMDHTLAGDEAHALVDQRLDQTLGRFLSRQELRPGMITSNLRLDSSHCRYAIRVAVAAIVAMASTSLINEYMPLSGIAKELGTHSYWVILTIVVVMKPGFALTRQRNGWRLGGTMVGCGLALLMFTEIQDVNVYLATMLVACILSYALLQVNLMVQSVFNTLYVLIMFHFTSSADAAIVGARLVDTTLGCAIALVCSYILPWWEQSFMGSLARAAKVAGHRYLRAGLHYAQVRRTLLNADASGLSAQERAMLEAEEGEADLAWRLARKNAHIAFANFASAFYRMMNEPVRHQRNVPELNNLLIQNHVLASQINAAVNVLATLRQVPPGVQQATEAIDLLLDDRDAVAPTSLETDGELATLAYPLRQMLKAAQLIRQEMQGLETEPN